MSVHVQITDGPLPQRPIARDCAGAGALLLFEGIVRPTEGERSIVALDYQAYRPMADEMLRQLAQESVARHGLLAIEVEHSQGRINAGECSFRLRIASRHRNEGLAAMAQFIDGMKQDVPIWKTPVYQPALAGDKT